MKKKSILVKDEYFEYNYHFKWAATCIYIVLNLEVPLLFVKKYAKEEIHQSKKKIIEYHFLLFTQYWYLFSPKWEDFIICCQKF